MEDKCTKSIGRNKGHGVGLGLCVVGKLWGAVISNVLTDCAMGLELVPMEQMESCNHDGGAFVLVDLLGGGEELVLEG